MDTRTHDVSTPLIKTALKCRYDAARESSMTKPFHGASLKIERANRHINDLYLESRVFHRSGIHSILVEDNSEGSDSVLQIAVTEDIPESVLLAVGDAVHNLMCALDFVMNDIEFAQRGFRSTFTKFPIYETRDKLVAAANGGLKGKAPKAVIDFIVDSIQPYKRGRGEPLWGLHALDIEDKHRLLIAKKDVTLIRNIACKDGRGERFMIPEWAFIGGKAPAHVCRGHSNVKIADKGKATFGIVFGDGMPFYGKPILPTLRDLSHFVTGTIDSIERVFGLPDRVQEPAKAE
jgi:hypothetical protein